MTNKSIDEMLADVKTNPDIKKRTDEASNTESYICQDCWQPNWKILYALIIVVLLWAYVIWEIIN